MKLLGIVILYHPEREVLANLDSYLCGVDTLLVWANSVLLGDFLQELKKKSVILLGNGKNQGLGIPMNQAVKYAIRGGFTHLLTMDQDSSFEKSDFLLYKQAVDALSDTHIGCFAPNHGWSAMDKDGMVKTTITSGSIFPISIFSEIGLFRDDFFIDGIDIEISYRLREHGYSIYCVDTVGMNHHLGNNTKFKLGKFTFSSVNYPPLRIYYILRNFTIIKKAYRKYWDDKGFYKFFLYRRFVQIVLFESNKWMKLKAMFWGLVHGFAGKTGKCEVKLS